MRAKQAFRSLHLEPGLLYRGVNLCLLTFPLPSMHMTRSKRKHHALLVQLSKVYYNITTHIHHGALMMNVQMYSDTH